MSIQPKETVSDSIETIHTDSQTYNANQLTLVIKKNTKSKYGEIKKLFVEWSLASTCQCYPKIFQYKNTYGILIWMVLFLVFTCLTYWFLIFGILDYFEGEVVSKIRVYNEETLIYPVVTICNANPFTTKEAENLLSDFIMDDNLIFKIMDYQESDPNMKTFFLNALKVQNTKNYGMYKAYYLNDLKKKELGLSMESMLRFCYLNGKWCNASDFSWVFSYTYGNCFQFDSKSNGSQLPKETKLSGETYGIVLVLGNLVNQNNRSSSISKGLQVFIHNNSYFSSSTEGVYVETGRQTDIAIKKTFTYRAPKPHSECQELTDFSSKSYDYIMHQNGQYSQKDCLEVCLQNIIIENCKCFYGGLPILKKGYAPCFMPNETGCFYASYYNNSAKLGNKCMLECPLECDSISYDLSSSIMDFPDEHFFQDIQRGSELYKQMSLAEFKKTHVFLNIFFKSKEYLEIRESPKTKFVDLVSNLGGALGIFLGFSVFSFVEVFEVIIQTILVIFKK